MLLSVLALTQTNATYSSEIYRGGRNQHRLRGVVHVFEDTPRAGMWRESLALPLSWSAGTEIHQTTVPSLTLTCGPCWHWRSSVENVHVHSTVHELPRPHTPSL